MLRRLPSAIELFGSPPVPQCHGAADGAWASTTGLAEPARRKALPCNQLIDMVISISTERDDRNVGDGQIRSSIADSAAQPAA
jgi:hypothetical protein